MADSKTSVMPRVALDSFKSVLYFPVWWYSAGLVNFAKGIANSIKGFNSSLGFTIWVNNIFTPLFAQYDFTSRVISFFLRLFNIIFRGLGLLIVIVFHLVFLLAWIVSLPLLVFLIFS